MNLQEFKAKLVSVDSRQQSLNTNTQYSYLTTLNNKYKSMWNIITLTLVILEYD